jgi:hypothetical protein
MKNFVSKINTPTVRKVAVIATVTVVFHVAAQYVAKKIDQTEDTSN